VIDQTSNESATLNLTSIPGGGSIGKEKNLFFPFFLPFDLFRVIRGENEIRGSKKDLTTECTKPEARHE